jgi:hypothetical protein
VEGITRDQEDQLKKKGGIQGKSEIEKWKEIYRILFPNDDMSKMPSPRMYISLIRLNKDLQEKVRMYAMAPAQMSELNQQYNSDVKDMTSRLRDDFIKLMSLEYGPVNDDLQQKVDKIVQSAMKDFRSPRKVIGSTSIDDSVNTATATAPTLSHTTSSGTISKHPPAQREQIPNNQEINQPLIPDQSQFRTHPRSLEPIPIEHSVVNQSKNPFLSQPSLWKSQTPGSAIGYLEDPGLVLPDDVPCLTDGSFASSHMDIAMGSETPHIPDTVDFYMPNTFHKLQNQALKRSDVDTGSLNPYYRSLAQPTHLTDTMDATSSNPFHRRLD